MARPLPPSPFRRFTLHNHVILTPPRQPGALQRAPLSRRGRVGGRSPPISERGRKCARAGTGCCSTDSTGVRNVR